MRRFTKSLLACGFAFLLLTPATFATEVAQESVAAVSQTPASIDWQLHTAHDGGVVSVTGPEGLVFQKTFDAGQDPSLVLGHLPDGFYTYQLWAAPELDAVTREAMARARANGTSEIAERDLRRAGKLPSEPMVLSGSFTVAGGTIVPSDAVEAVATKSAGQLPTPKTQVIAMDLIVQGSACVGVDCTSTESFGFDTIRLKENNLRIKFDDTSATGSFPFTDWQLTANDSANGGANKFSIDDVTNSRTPFTVLANAPNNSLFVNASGNVGFGTSTPVLDLHVVSGNTPALRLEQDGSSGFTAQTWDVAGNEANFFVRDVTNGSRLPFKIVPGAPTNSLAIASSGDVGVGTLSPATTLQIFGTDGDTQLRVSETSGTTAARTLFEMRNNGELNFIMRNTNTNENWQFLAYNDGFQISQVGNANAVFAFLENGDMQIPAGGSYTMASDRDLKENVEAVDPQQVLDKVLQLPIAVWNYKTQDDALRHMGPMAQDFYALFGLGNSETTISVADPGAVALAAIQGLHQEVEERDGTIESLRQKNTELEARLARLEALLGQ